MANIHDDIPGNNAIQQHYENLNDISNAEQNAAEDQPSFSEPDIEKAGETSADSSNVSSGKSKPPDGDAATKSDASEGSSSGGRFSLSNFNLRRRRTIAGLLTAGLLGGGGLFGISTLVQPAQLLQAGHVLSSANYKNDSDSADRNASLLRWAKAARTGNIGLTRVGVLGEKVYGKTITQLADIGITYETGRYGQKTRTVFDMKKLSASHPEINKMNFAEKQSFIADTINRASEGKLNISADSVQGKGNKFSIDVSKMSIGESRLLTKSNISLLNSGKIVSSFKLRSTSKVLGEPSLFHPWRRVEASVGKKLVNGKVVSEAEQNKKAEEEAKKSLAEKASGDGAKTATEDAKSKLSGTRASLAKAVTVTGFACIARNLSGAVIEIDRKRVVLPAMASAVRVISLSSQMTSGQDFTAGQVGAVVSSFTDKDGGTIWQNKAFNSLGGGDSEGLKDIKDEQKQAFASHKVASSIVSMTNGLLGGETVANVTCSTPALIAQGVAIIVLAGVAEVGSGGTATPAIIAAFGAKQAVNFGASYYAIKYISNLVLDKSTVDSLADDAFEGLNGGGLYAYGARAAANESAIAAGGVSLGNEKSTKLARDAAEMQRKDFQSKSLSARIFDVNDPLSLTGKLAQSINPSTSQNIASGVSGFKHIGSSFSKMASLLTPKASAAQNKAYDWGFPQYGLPDELLDDENLSDPYANADAVANILNSTCRDGDSVKDCDIRSRAMTCFGAEITLVADPDNGSYVWDTKTAQKEGGIDPNTSEYIDAKCADIKDTDWRRIIMFVSDTNTMKGAACYEGDAQSCKDLGVTGDPVGASAGGGSQFRLASFNILYSTADKAANWQLRIAKTAKVIGNETDGFQVVGLQEVRAEQYNALLSTLGSNWAGCPLTYTEKDGAYPGQNAIIWDTRQFSLVKGECKPIPGHQVHGQYGERVAMQVKLEDITTHQQFYLINSHEPVGNGSAIAARLASAELRKKQVNDLKAEGIPIFLTADWNAKYTADNPNQQTAGNTAEQKKHNLSYCLLTRDTGLWDAYDAERGLSGECPSYGKADAGDGPRGPVDHIFMSDTVTAQGYRYGGKGSNGSDHDTLSVEVTIPGEGSASSSPTPYKNPVFDGNIPDPSVVRDEDGTYHVYATGQHLQHLTSTDLVNWKRITTPIVTGAPSTATGKMWAPDVQRTDDHYTMTWAGSSGSLSFSIYYATSDSAAGPFKYRGRLIPPGYIGTYSLDPNIYMSPEGPILYYGSGGKGISAVKLKIASDGTITTTGPEKVLFGADPKTEWIAEGAWMQKHGDYYYMYYSVGRFDFAVPSVPEYKVKVARSKSPMGPFEKYATPVLESGNGAVRPGHNSIATDNVGNEWMVYHAYVGDKLARKLMIDPITYQSNGWPIVNDGHPSLSGRSDGPATGKTLEGALNGDLVNGIAWPVAKKWWDTNKSDFLGGHPTYSGTFTSPYVTGVAADIGDPPDGSPVFSMLDGTVEKTNLCGQGDGMMISSQVPGGTLHIAYGHGINPRFHVGETVKAGQRILDLSGVGCKVNGGHLHVDMALGTAHVCPQDVFIAMGQGQTPDFQALVSKGKSNCSRL